MTRLVSVSVSELKAKLSEHLRRVKAGETVMVTNRGRTIAQLSPPAPGVEALDAEMQDLVDAGLMTPPKHPLPPGFWDQPLPLDPDGLVLRALLDDRNEGL